MEDIKSSHLRCFVKRLTRVKSTALPDLLTYLDDVLTVASPDFADNFLQRCFGRVLALARARLQVYGKGLPPHVQWWKKELSCNGYDTETFPVRIGDKRKLDDGLAGFFTGDGLTDMYERLYVPALRTPASSDYLLHRTGLETSLTSKALSLTMLFDPCGHVGLHSGFLPQVRVTLNPDYFVQPLQRMEMLCRYAPVLGDPGNFEALLPGDKEARWHFSYLDEGGIPVSIDEILPTSILPPVKRVQAAEGYIVQQYKVND